MGKFDQYVDYSILKEPYYENEYYIVSYNANIQNYIRTNYHLITDFFQEENNETI